MPRKAPADPADEQVTLYVHVPRKFHHKYQALAKLRKTTPSKMLLAAFEQVEGGGIDEVLRRELEKHANEN